MGFISRHFVCEVVSDPGQKSALTLKAESLIGLFGQICKEIINYGFLFVQLVLMVLAVLDSGINLADSVGQAVDLFLDLAQNLALYLF